jgi:hypothetical protein
VSADVISSSCEFKRIVHGIKKTDMPCGKHAPQPVSGAVSVRRASGQMPSQEPIPSGLRPCPDGRASGSQRA